MIIAKYLVSSGFKHHLDVFTGDLRISIIEGESGLRGDRVDAEREYGIS